MKKKVGDVPTELIYVRDNKQLFCDTFPPNPLCGKKKKKAKDVIFCWFFNQWPIIWRHTRSKKWLFFYNLSCQNHCRQKVYPKRMAKVHLLWPVIWNSPIEGTEKVIKERSQRFIIGILNFLIHSEWCKFKPLWGSVFRVPQKNSRFSNSDYFFSLSSLFLLILPIFKNPSAPWSA